MRNGCLVTFRHIPRVLRVYLISLISSTLTGIAFLGIVRSQTPAINLFIFHRREYDVSCLQKSAIAVFQSMLITWNITLLFLLFSHLVPWVIYFALRCKHYLLHSVQIWRGKKYRMKECKLYELYTGYSNRNHDIYDWNNFSELQTFSDTGKGLHNDESIQH